MVVAADDDELASLQLTLATHARASEAFAVLLATLTQIADDWRCPELID